MCSDFRVVIAGAGVAGLEAALATRDLAGDRVAIDVLSPTGDFVYRPMLVAEPFGTADALRVPIAPILADAEARHRSDALAGVDLARRTVSTAAGDRLPYDALLIAIGARPRSSVTGALRFDPGSSNPGLQRVLLRIGARHLRRLAFVVPSEPTWTIAAYELALMTARERDARRIPNLEITIVTPELTPLAVFGGAASRMVRSTLDRAGIALRTSAHARRFDRRSLELGDGAAPIEVDQAVALPALEIPDLAGLPQRRHGFLGTDVAMHVEGLERVWAAGDATHFPIKQGGVAAQQARVAAQAIAARAGASVAVQPFRPVLRGAMITGETPEFFETELSAPHDGVASVGRPLWTPSIKLAADYLSPYISQALRGGARPGLHDVAPGTDQRESEVDHRRAVEVAVAAADVDASRGDYESALKWIALVEQLDLAVPAEYVVRREDWRRRIDPKRTTHLAAGRIDPSFATPEQAISDLRRRIGWLREAETRDGAEMGSELARLDSGIDDLVKLTRRVGTLTPIERG
jgi:sulfide:quinone oxidoreductase